MQCIILAAGRGTRMGALCDDTPKPMLPIEGKPKLAYSIEMLPDEITEVILIVGYLKEKIMDFFGDSYKGRKIRYVVHDTIDGTGKVLHSAKDILEDRFLVTMGDDFYQKSDLEKLIQNELGVLALEMKDVSSMAVLEIDALGALEHILEAPHTSSSHLVNTGAYMLTKDFFHYPLVPKSPGSKEYGLPQTMMQMRDKKNIFVVRATDWFPLGDPQAYNKVEQRLQDFL